ncbi:hypothetical protein P12x_003034 [Tundrisphaera lichenicola]|uniref:hypothetical protein n=1 Tax=Tundrisphaera lichenicola TaxID=2029860 RepID=UPI003EBBAAE7
MSNSGGCLTYLGVMFAISALAIWGAGHGALAVVLGVISVLVIVLGKLGSAGESSRSGPSSDGAMLNGPGKYAVDVVGESNYLANFERIFGKRGEDGVDETVEAGLVLEDSNPKDNQAVKVEIQGRTVGYLDRKTARSYRERLAEMNIGKPALRCSARVRGGWDRGVSDKGDFGVKLDLPT